MNNPDTALSVQNIQDTSGGAVLTKDELAQRWKISTKTVERLAGDRVHGVRSFRIRRQVRFRLRDIEEFESRHLTRQRAF